ncbi:Na+/H+ antiporter subunit E [Wenzhouxiangella marina]|uniref:Cation antiporter n=1 Tax=Wenzhouxiangella marina TaxID=1579979 RepID=A0A0K0XST3_9GAMM|nr:Na+/H+ antiporter subunit E [Wenzhouxiangella marina]AKS40769.1 Cation antiporter [Wenzhouxiangella marina]MBB6087642.1 multicomponent Na+:H+ antiporter subunit E [Wenzhouxiangella marina]
MRYLISLSLLLAALWLGISGVYKPLMFMLGAASVLVVVWLSRRMDVVGVEHNPALYSWRLPVYWAWLVGQIIKANLTVAKLVLNPARIRPQIVRVPVPLESKVAKVTYANSCTLTPGTVTLQLEPDELTAHVLDAGSAEDLQAGHMAARIAWLEQHDQGAK